MIKRIFIIILMILIIIPVFSLEVIILHTNDIRNVFQSRGATFINPDFPPTLGGVYSFATAIKWEREESQKDGNILLLFDSGNFAIKHIEHDSVSLSRAITIFNELKYDAVNLGIDEISSGAEYIEKNFINFNMPVLMSNISFINSDVNLKDYIIIEEKGVKIGIFGLTTEYSVFDLRKHILKTVKIEKEMEKAEMLVNILKQNKCDIIIGLTSIGLDHDFALADKIYGIDIIFGGYDGRGMREAVESPGNHTIIFKGFGELSSYEKIVLTLDDINNIESYTSESVTLFEEAFPPDKDMEKLLKRYE